MCINTNIKIRIIGLLKITLCLICPIFNILLFQMLSNMKESFKLMAYPLLLSNIFFTVGPILSAMLIPSFLPEYKLFMDFNPLRYALSFDAIIFALNRYIWQPSYAFLPIYTYLLQFLQYITSLVFENHQVPFVILAILVNKLLTAVNCLILVNFASNYFSQKGMRLVGILFLFNPAAIFYHSLYSEPIFMFFTLMGITYAFGSKQESKDTKSYLGSHLIGLVFFSLSTLVRTTGMFYSLIYGIPIIAELFRQLQMKRFVNSLKIILTGFIVILFFILPFIVYCIIGYFRFCNQHTRSFFCDNAIPNIYSAIEDVFWDVGFMRYYFKQQGMQIIFGMITIIVLAMTYKNDIYKTLQLKGLIISLIILALVIVFYANIQSGTRFISTHPAFYFNLAKHLMENKGQMTISNKIVVFYFALFNMFGMVFFPARFSWC